MIEKVVSERICQLCQKQDMSIYDLANISGMTPSTVYSVINGKSKNPGIVTIKKLCDGLDVSIVDFFNCDMFRDLEQEMY